MNTIFKVLIIIQVTLSVTTFADTTNNTSTLDDQRPMNVLPLEIADEDNNDQQDVLPEGLQEMNEELVKAHKEGRELSDNTEISTEKKEDRHAAFRKRAKPLKSIVMGIYRNYKSTYLGNRTTLEYKKRLRDHKNQKFDDVHLNFETDAIITTTASPQNTEMELNDIQFENDHEKDVESVTENKNVDHTQSDSSISTTSAPLEPATETEAATKLVENIKDVNSTLALKQKLRKRKRKHDGREKIAKKQKRFKVRPPAGGDDPLTYMRGHEYNYKVGPGFNMTLDMENDVVSVHLDAINLQQLMRGRWLSDNTEEGRGKKYDMVTKVLPLFVLPFLIQSAIVPFLVTKLKLLLMKSILVGKLAIFLLIISAIKNSSKSMQTYEVAPSYWAGEPSRRSELAAASSAAYNGYRVEGKPTAWIN